MTRKCMQCESRKHMVRFNDETFVITHATMTAEVEGLSAGVVEHVAKLSSTLPVRNATQRPAIHW